MLLQCMLPLCREVLCFFKVMTHCSISASQSHFQSLQKTEFSLIDGSLNSVKKDLWPSVSLEETICWEIR